MKLDVITLSGEKTGSIELDEALFGLEPRADILHRVVRWQRAKAQAGTHSTLGKSEVSYSTKKIYRQKGTGGARHGSKKAPIFRHGGVYKGPQPRSHAHDLPKQFRALGLRHALSAKAKAGELVILDTATLAEAKTAIESGDPAEMTAKTQALTEKAMKMGQAIYEKEQAAAASPDAAPAEGAEEVVDAEFSEVDENKG